MQRALLVGMGLVLVGGVVTPVVTPMGVDSASAASRAAMPFDFDGDGYADLAVGVSGEDLRGVQDAGAVQVLYGSAAGVTARDQLWHQGRKGIKNKLEKNDHFGQALASGDFDSDGYADLAVGIPGEDIRKRRDTGAVQALYGSPTGLTARDQVWHQGKPGVPGKNEAGDGFGGGLAVGDFDADGFADLAVGVGGEDIGSVENAGAVTVLRGSGSGLTSAGSVTLRQGRNGMPSTPAEDEAIGWRLDAGDVNGDGHDDLVMAVNDHDFNIVSDEAGEGAHVLFGSLSGLTPDGSQFFGPEDLGQPPDGGFGTVVVADVNADGRDDLAGILWKEDGAAFVLHGHADGLHPAPLVAPGGPGVDGYWADYTCSWELAATDFNGDGLVDLVCAGYAKSSSEKALSVILGTGSGLGTSVVDSVLDIGDFPSIDGLQALPLSGGSRGWLAVTGPQDYATSLSVPRNAGVVGVLQGTATGNAGPVTLWHQDSPGIKGKAEAGDLFRTLG